MKVLASLIVIGESFLKYMDVFKPLLTQSIKNVGDVQVSDMMDLRLWLS